MGDTTMAQNWHEQQLDMALKTRDRVAEGRACSNLGGNQWSHLYSFNPLTAEV